MKLKLKKPMVKLATSKWLPNILLVFLVAYPLAVFLGYADLINTFIMNLTQTIILITIVYSLHLACKRLISTILQSFNHSKDVLEAKSILNYWIMVCIDILLTASLIILTLLIWGLYPQTIYDVLNTIFISGIKIGESNFSVFFILKAVAVFFVVFYIFKLLLNILEKHVFPYTHADDGAKDAIQTIIGYIGLILAGIMAIYALGISSTSLAFIVSAFTFGISFGLKEIFNNFISGLILFIERPIKIGDWVNVAGETGVVKKIKLRATTVETFDKKTLMIPNSQFITSVVSNDLYNPISRATIALECGYDDDPQRVKSALIETAKAENGVLSDPEPSAVFTGFNESGLGFELRFHCQTIEKATICSNIRFSIIEAFRKEGFEIPYPKRDIYIKEGPNQAAQT